MKADELASEIRRLDQLVKEGHWAHDLSQILHAHALDIADALEESVRLRANRSLEALNLEAQIETLTGRLEKADVLLKETLKCAVPHPTEHPTMWAMWTKIHDYFGRKDG